MSYVFLTPNEFLEHVEEFERSGKDLVNFIKIDRSKTTNYINIKWYIDGKYKQVLIKCKKLEIKYGVTSFEKRKEKRFYKPNLCFAGDITFDTTKNDVITVQRYGDYRIKVHELLQLQLPEIQKIFPKITKIEAAVRFRRENKETGQDEDLDVPEISTKIKMVGSDQPETREDSLPSIEIRNNNKAKRMYRNGKIVTIIPEYKIEMTKVN